MINRRAGERTPDERRALAWLAQERERLERWQPPVLELARVMNAALGTSFGPMTAGGLWLDAGLRRERKEVLPWQRFKTGGDEGDES